MPWKETELMDLRTQFVAAFESKLFSMTELCKEYCISRKTGYKWLQRNREGGAGGLQNQSRARHSIAHRTPDDVVDAIIALRKKHPRWGPRKLLAILRSANPKVSERLPAPSTAGDLLKAAGLVPTRTRRRRPEHPGSHPLVAKEPNDVWCIDFKGEFKTRDGIWCYPLTVTDAASRYLLACAGQLSTAHAGAQSALQALFELAGLPAAIRSDNGCPFTTSAIGGISRLSVWFTKLGIRHDRTRPASPQDNGQHERMHRDLKAGTTRPPAADLAAQQVLFDAFRHEFNHVRPHEALGMQTPASIWTPSTRVLPACLPEPDYPGHMLERKVFTQGEFRFLGHRIFLSEVLAHEKIALDEVADAVWAIYFYNVLLAKLDQKTMTIVAIKPKPHVDRPSLAADTGKDVAD